MFYPPAFAEGYELCTCILWAVIRSDRIGSGRPNIPHISSMTSVMATAVTAPDSSLTIGNLEK